MRRILAVAMLLLPATIAASSCAAAETPLTMTKIVTRSLSQPVTAAKDETQTYWRAGISYLRMDVTSGPQGPTETLGVVNEPNVWMINNVNGIAQHMIDRGKAAHAPIFGEFSEPSQKREIRESGILQLEYGDELGFFKKRGAKQLPPATVDGYPVDEYQIVMGGLPVTLIVKKGSDRPWRIGYIQDRVPVQIEYESYMTDIPFKADLFQVPKTVKVIEAKKASPADSTK